MSEDITIARPYAQAVFQSAVERNNFEVWQKMLTLSATLSQEKLIQTFFISNRRSNDIADLFINILGNALNEEGRNLIKIMAQNNRLVLLPKVLSLFSDYVKEQEKQMDIEVTSASVLTASQLDAIKKTMENRFQKSVSLSKKIDKSLISGFILRAGDLVIDSSIKGRLNLLSTTLLS